MKYALVDLDTVTRRVYLVKFSNIKLQENSFEIVKSYASTPRVRFQFTVEEGEIDTLKVTRLAQERLENLLCNCSNTILLELQLVSPVF
jgi:hypothetical protein